MACTLRGGKCRYVTAKGRTHPPCQDSNGHRWQCALDRLCVILQQKVADPRYADSWISPEHVPYAELTAEVLQRVMDGDGTTNNGPSFRRVSLALPSPWRVYPDHNAAEFLRDAVMTLADQQPHRFEYAQPDWPWEANHFNRILGNFTAGERSQFEGTMRRWATHKNSTTGSHLVEPTTILSLMAQTTTSHP